jgi:hypothetical protein
MNEETKCPNCGSELITEISNHKYCNTLNADVDIIKNELLRVTGSPGHMARNPPLRQVH